MNTITTQGATQPVKNESSKQSAKERFKNRKKKADAAPAVQEKPAPVAAPKENNEWEQEETTDYVKTQFKIDQANTNEEKKDENEVADWDKIGESDFIQKSDAPKNIAVVDNTAQPTSSDSKGADSISFGQKPMFGGSRPVFKGLSKANMKQEYFPTLGDEAKPAATAAEDKPKQAGAPKFSGPNRFEGLKQIEKDNKANFRNNDDGEDRKPKFERKPREEKDEFFSNFRSTNKEIGQKEPESTKIDEPSAPSTGDDNKPKFMFTNSKKGVMTMAKAQEDAEKRKAEFEKLEAEKPKEPEKPKMKSDFKPREDDWSRGKKEFEKPRRTEEKPRKTEEKPVKRTKDEFKARKPKEPKVIKEAAKLEDDWGKGGLEDILN